jgi:hypothetical protein
MLTALDTVEVWAGVVIATDGGVASEDDFRKYLTVR